MKARSRLSHFLAARDPAHARLTSAAATAAGVLISALLGTVWVKQFHLETGMLSLSVFLSLMAGNMVKDHTAAGRVATTALLIPVVVAACLLSTLLSPWRFVVVAVFVGMTGVAIGVRRFGPRAAAMGSIAFMGYFFTLFMKPTLADLPGFLLIVASAIVAQLLVRAVQLLQRPRRQLTVLLREFRIASSAALHTALHHPHAGSMSTHLARLDEVGQAITNWQHRFRTERGIGCDAATLEQHVLDARVNTDNVCAALARLSLSEAPASPETLASSQARLTVLLDAPGTSERVAADIAWATDTIAQLTAHRETATTVDVVDYLIARCVLAHARLRKLVLAPVTAARTTPTPPQPSLPLAPPQAPASLSQTKRQFFTPLRTWSPATRVTVQAMFAAAIASVAGEAISDTRWYWAVLTAFVIFLGVTTRGEILTRAFRRISGTVGGIVIGAIAVLLIGDHTTGLIVISVCAVFGMLYLGPLNYLYSSLCITTMLVAVYRMLGVLNPQLLELRLIETLVGAVIGVLCAYLILSTSSHPSLLGKVNAYCDALDALVRAAGATQRAAAPTLTTVSGESGSANVMSALRTLEQRQADVDSAVSSMSAAFLVRADRQDRRVHLMHIATRAAASLAQSAASAAHPRTTPPTPDTDALADALRDAETAIADARHYILSLSSAMPLAPLPTRDVPEVRGTASIPGTIDEESVTALTRVTWAMREIAADARPTPHRVR